MNPSPQDDWRVIDLMPIDHQYAATAVELRGRMVNHTMFPFVVVETEIVGELKKLVSTGNHNRGGRLCVATCGSGPLSH
jgi:hypothetical protein